MGKTVRTTIVGGRPPDEGRALGRVPRGVEVLLKKASLDAEFKNALLKEPGDAARSIELELSEGERALLRAVPRKTLSQMVERIRVPARQRLAFAGTTAAVMLAALGTSLSGCDLVNPTLGSSPDRPDMQTDSVGDETEEPDEPKPPPVTRGASPDRPPRRTTKGHSPDRPEKMPTMGQGPDRPQPRTRDEAPATDEGPAE